jgi:hypothetical protein
VTLLWRSCARWFLNSAWKEWPTYFTPAGELPCEKALNRKRAAINLFTGKRDFVRKDIETELDSSPTFSSREQFIKGTLLTQIIEVNFHRCYFITQAIFAFFPLSSDGFP